MRASQALSRGSAWDRGSRTGDGHDGRVRVVADEDEQPLGVALAGPRGPHELDSRRAALAVQGAERGGGPLVVPEHVLVDRLRQQEVGDRVVAVGEPVQLDRQLVALLLGRHDEDLRGGGGNFTSCCSASNSAGPSLRQRSRSATPSTTSRAATWSEVVGGAGAAPSGRNGASRRIGRMYCARLDAEVPHSALEPVAEQGGERLALLDPVEEAERGPHPVGREVDLERLVLRVVVCQVAAAQDGGGGRLRQRRGMHEAVVDAGVGAGRSSSSQPYAAQVHPVGCGGPEGGQPPGRQRGVPGVEPVAVRVQQPAQRAVELVRRPAAQAVESRRELAEGVARSSARCRRPDGR